MHEGRSTPRYQLMQKLNHRSIEEENKKGFGTDKKNAHFHSKRTEINTACFLWATTCSFSAAEVLHRWARLAWIYTGDVRTYFTTDLILHHCLNKTWRTIFRRYFCMGSQVIETALLFLQWQFVAMTRDLFSSYQTKIRSSKTKPTPPPKPHHIDLPRRDKKKQC